MNAVQRQLLYCLSAYRQGEETAETAAELTGAEWMELHKLSTEQKMVPLVYETLWKTEGFCGADRNLQTRWKRETLLQAFSQAARSQRILEICVAFQQEEIPYALLKGLICRSLYSRPDLRPSGDEDLFIKAEDRQRCHMILKANGLEYLETVSRDSVTHWHDPRTGLHIELHTELFPAHRPEYAALNHIFTWQLDHRVTAAVPGGSVMTLSPTYHFTFLVCHALKHFLSSGVGIRTLCDIVSYMEKYERDISYQSVVELLETVRGNVFLAQILEIGRQWFGLRLEHSWESDCVLEPDELLQDSLEAGVYGSSTMSRKRSHAVVTEAAEHERTNLLRIAFPDRACMAGKFPVLNRYPILLPVMWVRRLGKYAVGVLCSRGRDNSPRESIAIGKKRTEMMVKYGILPKGKTKN